MMINKASTIGLYWAWSSVFTYRQFYVTILCATLKHGIWNVKYDTAITKNMVYPKVLLD
jgi:membrane protein insertase Oxa1/YidC/SpoIIIJ